MDGIFTCQPKPNGLFPEPESYCNANSGEKPLLLAMGSGIENTAVPVTGFAEKFSLIPLMAPPPEGSVKVGNSFVGVVIDCPSEFCGN